MTPPLLLAVLLLVATALAGGGLALALRRRLRRWRNDRRLARARRLETEAPALLLRRGFRAVERRVRRQAVLLVDGQARQFEVELDYLVVDLEDRTFVAEVKSGEEAPDPLLRATRRQLLEYAVLVPEAAGLLLVDMEAGRVHEVVFPALTVRRAPPSAEPRLAVADHGSPSRQVPVPVRADGRHGPGRPLAREPYRELELLDESVPSRGRVAGPCRPLQGRLEVTMHPGSEAP